MARPVNLSGEMLLAEVKRLLAENWALTQECLVRAQREEELEAVIAQLSPPAEEAAPPVNRAARRRART